MTWCADPPEIDVYLTSSDGRLELGADVSPDRTFWRYYFAGQALAGMDLRGDYSAGPCNAAVVKRCVLIADHLLDALESDHTFGSPEVSDAG